MTVRDEFFWLGEINKATLVINSRQGLLPMPIAEEAAKALREVLADGDADPTKRAKTYITFEPLMLKKADPVITLMHAGRSSRICTQLIVLPFFATMFSKSVTH